MSLFSVLALAFLLKWWQKQDAKIWLLLCLLLGVGSIVKSNMLLLLAAVILCLLATNGLTWKNKYPFRLHAPCNAHNESPEPYNMLPHK